MKQLMRTLSFAVLAVATLGPSGSASPPGNGASPPNWKGSASGSTVLGNFYVDDNDDFHRVDIDSFSGKSSHLGRFTATGSHDLNLSTFAFTGHATWTASNGDTLTVSYAGQLIPPTGLPGALPYPYGTYPFEFVSTLVVTGGTGRFANAQGQASWSGAFSGDGAFVPVPVANVFYFGFEGTLHYGGN